MIKKREGCRKYLKKNKKANILIENIVFIILNVVFLAILVLFLFSKMGGVAVLEEKYAKQIALIIDSAKPGMEIRINMEDAFDEARKNDWEKEDVVIINSENNLVTVKLREGKGYSYSFFNDVEISSYYDSLEKDNYFIREIKYKNG